MPTFGCTDSNTMTSTGPVASSSVRKMMRWPLRIAGVCEATLTPATMTFGAAPERDRRSLRPGHPQVGQQRFEEAHDVAGGIHPQHLELGPNHLGIGVILELEPGLVPVGPRR